MTSEKQITANAGNAKLSTGPKSTEGRDASSKNALRHGLLAKKSFLECENEDDYSQLAENVTSQLKPINVLEHEIVSHIISVLWRLRRISIVETGIFLWEQRSLLADYALSSSQKLRKLCFAEDEIGITYSNKKVYCELVKQHANEQNKQYEAISVLGKSFMQQEGVDSFTKLARYEGALQRMLSRLLSMLKEMRSERSMATNTHVPSQN